MPEASATAPHSVHSEERLPSGSLAAAERAPRVYALSALGWITFFGGPLAGALGLAYNARRFGADREATYAVAAGAIAMGLLVAIGFYLPEHIGGSFLLRTATALLGLLAVTAIAEKTQGARIRAHKAAGGRDASGWLGVGMVLTSWAFIFLVSFVVVLFTPVFNGTPYERAGGGTMYASGDASQADARYVGSALQQFGYFPEGEAAQVLRTADSVFVTMLLIPEVETDSLFLQEAADLARHLSGLVQSPVAVVNAVDGFSGRRETVLAAHPRAPASGASGSPAPPEAP